jgi:hypothetical protein
MENPIKLPSGRIAYKQTNEDAYTIYGPDNTTFIACLPAEDIKALADHNKEIEAAKRIEAGERIEAIRNGTALFKNLF